MRAVKVDCRTLRSKLSRAAKWWDMRKVYAPFDGIAARNVDNAAHWCTGCTFPAQNCFTSPPTRLCVSASCFRRACGESNGADVGCRPPGCEERGRNSDTIDVASNATCEVERQRIPPGQLLPGSYVSVHLKLPSKTHGVTIPANSPLFPLGRLQVAWYRLTKRFLVHLLTLRT